MGLAAHRRRVWQPALPFAALCLLGLLFLSPPRVIDQADGIEDGGTAADAGLGWVPLLGETEEIIALATASRQALLKANNLLPTNASDLEEAGVLLNKRRFALRKLLIADNQLRREWRARLATAAPRGIAVCAGGPRALVNAFVALHVLRNTLGCTLPVVVLHWGQQEVANGTSEFFAHHIPGVEFMDLSAPGLYPSHHRGVQQAPAPPQEQSFWEQAPPATPADSSFGFKLKALSLYLAPFREVLLMDADNLALADPAPLFELDVFARQGNLFWPDFWRASVPLWGHLGMDNHDPWAHNTSAWEWFRDGGARPVGAAERAPRRAPLQAESGQILIDRARHWKALEWALFLNTNEDFVYRLPGMYGDKDTFRVAFALAEDSWAYRQVPHPPCVAIIDQYAVGQTNTEPRWRFAGMVQLHPDGSPLFHHRTAYSKFPAGARAGELAGPLTHISAPASPKQAALATYSWPAGWGVGSMDAQSLGCGGVCPECSLEALWEVERVCTAGRREAEKEDNARPVMMVDVETGSTVHTASAAAARAHDLIPFNR